MSTRMWVETFTVGPWVARGLGMQHLPIGTLPHLGWCITSELLTTRTLVRHFWAIIFILSNWTLLNSPPSSIWSWSFSPCSSRSLGTEGPVWICCLFCHKRRRSKMQWQCLGCRQCVRPSALLWSLWELLISFPMNKIAFPFLFSLSSRGNKLENQKEIL